MKSSASNTEVNVSLNEFEKRYAYISIANHSTLKQTILGEERQPNNNKLLTLKIPTIQSRNAKLSASCAKPIAKAFLAGELLEATHGTDN